MKPLPLSLILVCRNAETVLPRCLDSVAGLPAEIIAVINDCSDGTRAILEKYGARVFEHPWQGMAAQKQFALEQATQSWVLNLDADEALAPRLVWRIRRFLEGEAVGYEALRCRRKTWFLGRWVRHGDWYPEERVRLFRREAGRFEGDAGHDEVAVDGAIARCKENIFHYSFPTLSEQILKMPGFGDAHLAREQERGRQGSALTTAGRACWRFVRAYFLRLGFLDGFAGFYIASYTAFFTLYRHSRLLEARVLDRQPTPQKEDLPPEPLPHA